MPQTPEAPLSPLQKEAAVFLVSSELGHTELTTEEFADNIGVTSRSIRNWQHLPAFIRECERLREGMEEAKDVFAKASRLNALFTLHHNLAQAQKKLQGEDDSAKYAALSREVRQYAQAIITSTEDVEMGHVVSARELTDEQLIAKCLKDDCLPQGLSRDDAVKALAELKGEPCSNVSSSSASPSEQSGGASSSPATASSAPASNATSPSARNRAPRKSPSRKKSSRSTKRAG